MAENHQLRDWVRLSLITGVGSRLAGRLLDHFGSPAACFAAEPSKLEALGLKRDSIEALKGAEASERAESEIEAIQRLGGQIITLDCADYPSLLQETYDPPIVLYALGDFARALRQPAIAMVGSRRCSTYGRNAAEMLARQLAERGITIVSGLARGIDTAAHRGTLDGQGLTIAVTGTGLDGVYPKENRKLAERIQEQGAILTEFPLRTPPLPQNFPFRNRVISGMAFGVMVVEGAERSGSLITARLAYEQGREVFAVPGNITSANSFGPNYLIKDGAKLVQTWRDVVEELPMEVKARILAGERATKASEQLSLDEVALSEAEKKVFGLLTFDGAVHVDQLMSQAGLSAGQLMSALLTLEMTERIRQLPGKNFVRKL